MSTIRRELTNKQKPGFVDVVKIVTADQCEIAEISGKTHHERWAVVEDCLVNHGQVIYVKRVIFEEFPDC